MQERNAFDELKAHFGSHMTFGTAGMSLSPMVVRSFVSFQKKKKKIQKSYRSNYINIDQLTFCIMYYYYADRIDINLFSISQFQSQNHAIVQWYFPQSNFVFGQSCHRCNSTLDQLISVITLITMISFPYRSSSGYGCRLE